VKAILCRPCLLMVLVALGGALLLGGCAMHEPLEAPQRGEMGKSPGLFSGEDGEFLILGR
jgi:hypothetical protein